MSWVELHRQSFEVAEFAEAALRAGDENEARQLYAKAAVLEELALDDLSPTKERTLGVSVVSGVSLYYKARNYTKSEALAYKWLASGRLPSFAEHELRLLLQATWMETAQERAGVRFTPEQVIVAVKGGEIVTGGAPIDLIVQKVQTVQSLFYRTAEWLKGLPHRKHGPPSQKIQEACRPWLFQTVPGSYQFAVAVQEPPQFDLFGEQGPTARDIASNFLQILRASAEDPDESLRELVPKEDYRDTFLKLTRNLAPSGKSHTSLEIRSPEEPRPISLLPEVRKNIGIAIRREAKEKWREAEQEIVELRGVLRAVHLDKDWLELAVEDELIHVSRVVEAVDDVIGPMVNRPVIVSTIQDRGGRHRFHDIELDD